MNRGRLVGHNGAVTALTLNQDTIMTGSRDRLIKLYDSDAVQGHSSDGITTSQSNVPPSYVSVCVCVFVWVSIFSPSLPPSLSSYVSMCV